MTTTTTHPLQAANRPPSPDHLLLVEYLKAHPNSLSGEIADALGWTRHGVKTGNYPLTHRSMIGGGGK